MADDRPPSGAPPGPKSDEPWQKNLALLDVAWQLVGAVGLGVLGGWFLDGRLHTAPWLLVAGSLLGMTAGFVALFRTISKTAPRKPPT